MERRSTLPDTSTVRIGSELLARADGVAEAMDRDPKATRHGQVSRSRVVREALAIGLAAMEEQWDVLPKAAA